MRTGRIGWVAWVALVSLASIASAGDDFASLLTKAPRGANLLVTVNAESLFASELATAKNWRQEYENNYARAPLLLPPEASQGAVTALLDLGDLAPRWESVLLRTKSDVPLGMVRRLTKGKTDTVNGKEAVLTPSDTYVVKLGDREFGLMRPGDRQAVSRWVREALASDAAPLTPYLSEAAVYPDRAGTQIVMAIDLTDALSRERVLAGIAGFDAIKQAGIDPAEATDALMSLRGLTLGVKVKGKAIGSLKVDFSGPYEAIAPIAKPLLIEALDHNGAAIAEFKDWSLETGADGFRISGELSESGMTRLFSILEVDASVVGAEQDETGENESDRYDVDVEKSQEYYHAVQKHLHDLKLETGAKTYTSIARWFDKYANRIDRLPILQIDPQLVDFSAHTVGQLRDCSEAIRAAALQSGSRGSTVTAYSTGSYWDYANSNYMSRQTDGIRSAEAERIAIRRQERAKSSTTVREIMRQVNEDTSRMRRELTQRYQVEF